jgi:GAF domain-containing protein
MPRGQKPTKSKAESDRPVARKSPKVDDAHVRDLKQRLEEALKGKAEALTLQAEAQEQQGATSEILRVISQSPTDAQPVFDVIVENACRLCDGVFANVVRFDGSLMHNMAEYGFSPEAREMLLRSFPTASLARSMSGRAILNCAVVQSEDMSTDVETTISHQLSQLMGFRAQVSVPMLRNGVPVGAITVARRERGLFPERQVALLKTFADQAVIAIENVRLFKEAGARNHELTEALDQQTATSEILRVISSSPTDVQPVFDSIVQSAVRLCGGAHSALFREDRGMVQLAAHHNFTDEARAVMERFFPAPLESPLPAVTVIKSGKAIHVADVLTDLGAASGAGPVAETLGFRNLLIVPLLLHDRPIGAIAVARHMAEMFPESQVELLKTFADQAVIAIENVRLFTELQTSNHELTTALDTQTTTSEILRVIASSPTDIQPVFDAVVRNGARLCEAANASLHVREGEVMRKVAEFGHVSTRLTIGETRPIMRTTVSGRAMIEGRTINIGDLHKAEMGYEYPDSRHVPETRACLGIPLLREGGEAVGALFIFRTEDRPFTEKHVGLLQTFADQAVIAIENVRLFTELQEKNRALTEAHVQVSESLEQQTATGEILRVISRSPTDVQPVFDRDPR